MSSDQGKPLLLVLLDLSAAFDTVDCVVLLSRLKDLLVLSGTVLQLFQLFMVFYLMFNFYHLVYNGVQFLVLRFSQRIIIAIWRRISPVCRWHTAVYITGLFYLNHWYKPLLRIALKINKNSLVFTFLIFILFMIFFLIGSDSIQDNDKVVILIYF